MKVFTLFFPHRRACPKGWGTSSVERSQKLTQSGIFCPDCLTRKNRAGKTEYFHRSVVCMTVGKATACDPGAGNAEVEGRSGKGWRGTDRRKTPDIFYKNAQAKKLSYCSRVSWTWENRWCRLITVKAIGFLYPNILDTLSYILAGSSRRIKTSMLMHWQR